MKEGLLKEKINELAITDEDTNELMLQLEFIFEILDEVRNDILEDIVSQNDYESFQILKSRVVKWFGSGEVNKEK